MNDCLVNGHLFVYVSMNVERCHYCPKIKSKYLDDDWDRFISRVIYN